MSLDQVQEHQEMDGDAVERLLLIAETALDSDRFRPLGQTLDQICSYVRTMLGCAVAMIRILDDENQLVIRGHDGHGFIDEVQRLGDATLSLSLKGRRNPSVDVFSTGRAQFVHTDEFEVGSDARARLIKMGIESNYFAPIMRDGMTVGVLSCYWSERHGLDAEQAALVSLMCRLASVSLGTALIADNVNRLHKGLEEVHEQLQDDNSQLRDIHIAQSRMIKLLSDGSSLTVEQTARTLGSALRRSVIVCGPNGQELALEATRDHIPFLRDAAKRHCGRGGAAELAQDAPYSLVRIEGPANGAPLGVIILAPPITDSQEFNQVIAKQAALVIGTHIQGRETNSAITNLALPSALLAMSRDLYNASQIKETAALLEVSNDTELCLALIHTPTPEAAFRISRRRASFVAAGWPVLVAVADGSDVLVLLRGGPIDRETAASLIDMHQEVHCIGLSSTLKGIGGLGRGLKQARMAKAIAATHQSVAHYDDFGSFVDITGGMGVEQMRHFVDAVLGEVVRYDKARGTELIKSLQVFIEKDGQAPESAAALSVHVNTLHKRMRRVEELSGLCLRAFRDIAQVTLALDMMPTVNGVVDRRP